MLQGETLLGLALNYLVFRTQSLGLGSLRELLSAPISKCATTTQFGRHGRPQVQLGSMLIYHGRRLRAPVALHAVEILRGDAMLAESACEYSAAV
jgi:hypothetical protein